MHKIKDIMSIKFKANTNKQTNQHKKYYVCVVSGFISKGRNEHETWKGERFLLKIINKIWKIRIIRRKVNHSQELSHTFFLSTFYYKHHEASCRKENNIKMQWDLSTRDEVFALTSKPNTLMDHKAKYSIKSTRIHDWSQNKTG